MTDKNNNQIWGYFYGAAEKNPLLSLSKVARKNDIVVIGPAGAAGSMAIVDQCIKSGIPYMFDPGFILTQIHNKDLVKGVHHADYLIGNDYEIDLIRSRIPQWEKLFSKKVVITTLGEKGAEIQAQGKKYTIAPVHVPSVVDPTGAGDAWRSGFLAGLEKGFSLQVCGQMGAVASAFVLEKYGTQEHAYTKELFVKRYRQSYKSLLKL